MLSVKGEAVQNLRELDEFKRFMSEILTPIRRLRRYVSYIRDLLRHESARAVRELEYTRHAIHDTFYIAAGILERREGHPLPWRMYAILEKNPY